MTLRIGFYGAGFITSVHTWFLRTCGVDHEIVAVHDPDQARAEAFAAKRGGRAVGEDELLELVDVVYVCSWTAEHPRLVAKAAAAGKAVFCEKPLAVDAPTTEEMIRTVEAAGVPNQVGLVLRYCTSFQLAKALLADPKAGRAMAVVFRDDQYIPIQGQYASTWRAEPDKCGRGAMLEHSIHDLDILQWMLGPVDAVAATTRELHGLDQIDDIAAVRLDFASGATGTLVSVWHDILERQSNRHVELFTEKLFIAIEGDLTGPVRWRFTGEEEHVLEGEALADELRSRGIDASNPATAFLTAVLEGTPASPSFADALAAHRLVDAVYESGASKGAVVEVR